jgi:hypothetical protein
MMDIDFTDKVLGANVSNVLHGFNTN